MRQLFTEGERQALDEARGGFTTYYSDFKSLADTIQRWQKENEKLYDHSQPVMVPVAELWKHREYTWTRDDARMTSAEWDMLKASLKRGWDAKHWIYIQVGQKGGVKVGEGNHRLSIARGSGCESSPSESTSTPAASPKALSIRRRCAWTSRRWSSLRRGNSPSATSRRRRKRRLR